MIAIDSAGLSEFVCEARQWGLGMPVCLYVCLFVPLKRSCATTAVTTPHTQHSQWVACSPVPSAVGVCAVRLGPSCAPTAHESFFSTFLVSLSLSLCVCTISSTSIGYDHKL